MTDLKSKTVAIIGAGPAGMAAALQLHRFGINTLLFEQPNQNSLLKNAWRVENYLGVYPGKSGIDLLKQFQINLVKSKIKKINAKVEELNYSFKTKGFEIKTIGKVYYVDYVIVASGTKPKLLIKNPSAAISSKLFYDVFPLLKSRKKNILIIGAGDAAFDYALNLAKYNKVIICNRAKHSNALSFLINRALKHRNITYFQDYKISDVFPVTAKKKLGCIFANQQKHVYIEADYVLIAVGRLPQKDFYMSKLHMIEKRLIREERLFLAGDVKNNIYRQVAIAVGDGVKVAMQIFHRLIKYES